MSFTMGLYIILILMVFHLQRAGGVRPPRWTPPRAWPSAENGENKRKTLSKSSNNSAQSDTSENVRYVYL